MGQGLSISTLLQRHMEIHGIIFRQMQKKEANRNRLCNLVTVTYLQ